MKRLFSKVTANTLLCDRVYRMDFSWDASLAPPAPGQFCTIRACPGTSPLLRRPFAFSHFDAGACTASIVYKKCGPATEILAGKALGDPLDVIGPLGNSFVDFPHTETGILVAGGTGLGPVFFWNHYLRRQGHRPSMILGLRSKAQVPRLDEINDSDVAICTEDGSRGFKGTTVEFLLQLPHIRTAGATLICCGPTPMLKACHEFGLARGLECLVSLEQVMACGVGACMGCVVRTVGEPGFARVCSDGPVFNSKVIAWT